MLRRSKRRKMGKRVCSHRKRAPRWLLSQMWDAFRLKPSGQCPSHAENRSRRRVRNYTGPVAFDYGKMKLRKDDVVEKIRKSLEGLILSNGMVILRGTCGISFSPRNQDQRQAQSHHPCGKDNHRHRIEPLDIPAFPCDHKRVFNSTSILELTYFLKTFAIIGGGYIGCEFAVLFC